MKLPKKPTIDKCNAKRCGDPNVAGSLFSYSEALAAVASYPVCAKHLDEGVRSGLKLAYDASASASESPVDEPEQAEVVQVPEPEQTVVVPPPEPPEPPQGVIPQSVTDKLRAVIEARVGGLRDTDASLDIVAKLPMDRPQVFEECKGFLSDIGLLIKSLDEMRETYSKPAHAQWMAWNSLFNGYIKPLKRIKKHLEQRMGQQFLAAERARDGALATIQAHADAGVEIPQEAIEEAHGQQMTSGDGISVRRIWRWRFREGADPKALPPWALMPNEKLIKQAVEEHGPKAAGMLNGVVEVFEEAAVRRSSSHG